MRFAFCKSAIVLLSVAVLLASAVETHARHGDGIGIIAGQDTGSNDFFLGGQAEFGPITNSAFLVPSFHVGFGEGASGAANLDLRWYLLPLPETGIRIYGAAGPTMLFASGADIGLSLTAGFDIPMKNRRRYNVELRFGFGDVPDLKFGAAVTFGI
jgi:hypothetical protein